MVWWSVYLVERFHFTLTNSTYQAKFITQIRVIFLDAHSWLWSLMALASNFAITLILLCFLVVTFASSNVQLCSHSFFHTNHILIFASIYVWFSFCRFILCIWVRVTKAKATMSHSYLMTPTLAWCRVFSEGFTLTYCSFCCSISVS